MKKTLIALGVIVVLVAGYGLYKTTASSRYGGTTNLDYLTLSGDLNVAGANNATSSSYYASNLRTGGLTYATSSLNSTDFILDASQIATSSVIRFIPQNTAVNVWLPTAANLATLLPNVGDSYRFVIYNSTTTGTTNLTIKATSSANVELLTASSTAGIPQFTIGRGRDALIIIFKMASSSVRAMMVSD